MSFNNNNNYNYHHNHNNHHPQQQQHREGSFLPSGLSTFHSFSSNDGSTATTDEMDYSITTTTPSEHHQQQQQERKMEKLNKTISGSGGTTTRTKRTRGPRSCLECRSSKQKCEQLNYATLIPSSEPQPAQMSCRRCRVLGLPCIVPDQLPKSTRLRMERNRNQLGMVEQQSEGGSSIQNPISVQHNRRPTWPNSNSFEIDQAQSQQQQQFNHPSNSQFNRNPINSLFSSDPNSTNTPSLPPIAQDEHRRAFSFSTTGGNPFQPGMFTPPSESSNSIVATTADHHHQHQQHSHNHQQHLPQPSFPPPQQTNRTRFSSHHSGRSSLSPQHNRLSSNSNFDPNILDPIPILKGGESGRMHSSIQPSMGNISTPIDQSPISQTSSGMESFSAATNEYSWFYRARIACRPAQLLEHLIGNGIEISNDDLKGLPLLEDLIKHLMNNQLFLQNVANRMTNLQSSIPYLINFQTLLEDIENSAFLLGVGMYLEGKGILEEDLKVLRNHLAFRCSQNVERLSENIFDIQAMVVIAIFCPLLLPSTNLIGVSAGNALLFSAIRSCKQLGFSNAPNQLGSIIDSSSVPALDSHIVSNASIWIHLSWQMQTLELIDDPMSKGSIHPRALSSYSSIGYASREDTEMLERYCRMMIDNENTPQTMISLRCAILIMICIATRQTFGVIELMKEFTQQFEDSLLKITESAPRINALKRWTEQVIDSLGMQMASGREELRLISTYLGGKGLVTSNQLKYFELSLSAMEFACLGRMKDKLFIIGKTFFGVPKTSHEFLFSLFSRPQLLKSFEHLAIVRLCVARHVLTLFTNLALDLQPNRRRNSKSSLTSQNEPLAHWDSLAHVFPLTRWCGILICCASVLVEEIAGRFIAQESPYGSSGDSRLEIYYMLSKQTYDCLVLFEEDLKMRYQNNSKEEEFEFEQVKMLRTVLDSLEKNLAALSTWRKKASGVGQYGQSSTMTITKKNHQIPPIQDTTITQPIQLFNPSIIVPFPTSSNPSNSPAQIISPTSENLIQNKQQHHHHLPQQTTMQLNNNSNDRQQQQQVQFGDALLHDILFTPIEQFFDGT